MKRSEIRHYTEEELLMHLLQEEESEFGSGIVDHLRQCQECGAVFHEFVELQSKVLRWELQEATEETWQNRKSQLLDLLLQDQARMTRVGMLSSLKLGFQAVWDYALNNPLPTLGYVAAAIAFASERTITVFRLDHILPSTSEVFEILKQVL